MEAIVKRVRFAMQAILIATLLLILPVSSEQPDILSLATRSADTIALLRPCWMAVSGKFPNDSKNEEFHQYWLGIVSEDSPTSPDDRSAIVSNWQVQDIIVFRSYLSLRATENFADVECSVGSDDLNELSESLSLLDKLYREARLGSQATFAELAEASRARVQIPVIGEAVYTEKAAKVLGTAILVLLVYLVSLLSALMASIDRSFEENAMDWIFFHPGFLGVTLGLIWLCLPSVIMLIAIIRQTVSLLFGTALVIGQVTSAGWAIYKSMMVRKAVQSVLGNPF